MFFSFFELDKLETHWISLIKILYLTYLNLKTSVKLHEISIHTFTLHFFFF